MAESSIDLCYNAFVSTYFNGNHLAAEAILSSAINIGFYWALSLLYTFFDLTGKPRVIQRYKIQPTTQICNLNLTKLICQILFNQLLAIFVGFPILLLKYHYVDLQQHIPSFSRFLLEFTVFVLVRETMFYYSHRILHYPPVYKRYHKQHHEWQTPIAIMAMYCHPVEHLVSNVVPIMLGPILMRSHPITIYLWIAYAISLGLNDHCGYHLPFNLTPPVFHDFHHLKFNGNYGIMGLMDWLHGTDKLFRRSKYYQQNRVYFTLTPPKEIYYSKLSIIRHRSGSQKWAKVTNNELEKNVC